MKHLLEVHVTASQAAVLSVNQKAITADILFDTDNTVWLEHAATAL
jgi:hypothetical protein